MGLVIGQTMILLLSDSAMTKAGRLLVADASENGKGTEITSPLLRFSIDPSKLRLPLDLAKPYSVMTHSIQENLLLVFGNHLGR